MHRPLLTVLTDPVPYGTYFPIVFAKCILRKIKRFLKPIPHYMISPYRGHPAVTRSLVEGLIKAGIDANYNPKSHHEIGNTVVVLSGISALKQAIRLKRKGYIKKILAGPNMVEFPTDYNSLITSKEVDLCVTPCDWTNTLYQNISPELFGRCVAWPAGVDIDYWKPNNELNRDTILIYEKQRKGPVGPVSPYKEWLQRKGYKVEIIRCGEYTLDEFLSALQRSFLMVGFVVDESQGLAWAEAWSADVPTLIWRNTLSTLRGISYDCSTAPYLNSENGLFFDNFEDFKLVFFDFEVRKSLLTPRQWVLDNMSDEVCAINLCRIAGLL